jgi:hypothetical protein
MASVIKDRLKEIGTIIQNGIDSEGVRCILHLLEVPGYSKELIEDTTLYSELLPPGTGDAIHSGAALSSFFVGCIGQTAHLPQCQFQHPFVA